MDNRPAVEITSPGRVEGLFDLTGTVTFKEHAGGEEGLVEVYIDGTRRKHRKCVKTYEGTQVSWSYRDMTGEFLDAGQWGNGTHRIYVRARAHNGTWSKWSGDTFEIDNTPRVIVTDPGVRLHGEAVDVLGSVDFREHAGGLEGTVELYLNGKRRQHRKGRKAYEGTEISWSYEQVTGSLLDTTKLSPGKHTLYARARAHNGAWSAWAKTTLILLSKGQLVDAKNLGPGRGPCETRANTGDPVNFATGNMFHIDEDLRIQGPGLPFRLERYYNSRANEDGLLGHGWSFTWSDRVINQGDSLLLKTTSGMAIRFTKAEKHVYHAETDYREVIRKVPDGYERIDRYDRTWRFDASGRLLEISDPNGNTQVVWYEEQRPSGVEDSLGRTLAFAYNQQGKLESVSGPAGRISFAYDQEGNLTDVVYPDDTRKRYLYEDPSDPHNLTGVIDERGLRVTTVTYDRRDRAVMTSGADGMEQVHIQYGPANKRTITDSLGREKVFHLHVAHGIGRVAEASGSGCKTCLTESGAVYDLDHRLSITRREDKSGRATTLTHDARGHVLTRTEAAGTSQERTTRYTYHPIFNRLASERVRSVTDSSRDSETLYVYDDRGNLTLRVRKGYSPSGDVQSFTSYTYDERGRILSVNGPRRDVEDITRFVYYPDRPDQGLDRGMLRKIIDPMGHQTRLSMYNGYGLPERIEDANGGITSLSYNLRGRLVSSMTNHEETRYTYDEAGHLTRLTLPGGKTLHYGYSDAGRLELVEDGQGNQIRFAHDTEGNQTRTEIYDQQGEQATQLRYAYDAFNRLQHLLYPGDAAEERTYDDAGNITSILDANGRVTQYTYDLHNRQTSVLQPEGAETHLAYDPHGNLIRVKDARDHVTAYTYDDLGRMLETVSPDTGRTEYRYDESGNLTSRTDEKGVQASYTYDAADRLTRITWPDSTSLRLGYDHGDHAKGRLSSMEDPAGRTDYAYDAFGRITQETRSIDEARYTTQYRYDGNGDLTGLTYPSGLEIEYQRDPDGRITQVLAGEEALTTIHTRLPFGPAARIEYPAGLPDQQRTYDGRYLLDTLTMDHLIAYRYIRDPAGSILSVDGAADPAPPGESTSYEYTGNRLTALENGQRREMTYDPNGNLVSDGMRTFEYNLQNRLTRVLQGESTIAVYAYDGRNRRVKKIAGDQTIHYHYDLEGRLIAETGPDGRPLRDIIYQDGERIAMKVYGEQTETCFFLNDHLGTPRKLVNTEGRTVWHAAYLPFGEAFIIQEEVENPFRFPGQYFDKETGLHYNWHRYYDPEIGRYLRADPIGVRGDINLYVYASSSPILYSDPMGLCKNSCKPYYFPSKVINESYKAIIQAYELFAYNDKMHMEIEFGLKASWEGIKFTKYMVVKDIAITLFDVPELRSVESVFIAKRLISYGMTARSLLKVENDINELENKLYLIKNEVYGNE